MERFFFLFLFLTLYLSFETTIINLTRTRWIGPWSSLNRTVFVETVILFKIYCFIAFVLILWLHFDFLWIELVHGICIFGEKNMFFSLQVVLCWSPITVSTIWDLVLFVCSVIAHLIFVLSELIYYLLFPFFFNHFGWQILFLMNWCVFLFCRNPCLLYLKFMFSFS